VIFDLREENHENAFDSIHIDSEFIWNEIDGRELQDEEPRLIVCPEYLNGCPSLSYNISRLGIGLKCYRICSTSVSAPHRERRTTVSLCLPNDIM
jgi:hypothetical protein